MAGEPAHPLAGSETPNAPEVEAVYAHAPNPLVAEILHGIVMMSPRPAPRHTRLALRLSTLLYGPFDEGKGGPGGWIFLPEPELHLGERPDKMEPDLAGWRLVRLPQMPTEAALRLAPDWVCEVLSPSTEAVDRGVKMPLYATHGVRYAWLIDPLERSLEGFRSEAGRWRQIVLARGEERVRVEPFEALEIDLARLWRWHDPA
jgi:Uma2 family endonuclease